MPSKVLFKLVCRLFDWPTIDSIVANCLLYLAKRSVILTSNLSSCFLYSLILVVRLVLWVVKGAVVSSKAVSFLTASPATPDGNMLSLLWFSRLPVTKVTTLSKLFLSALSSLVLSIDSTPFWSRLKPMSRNADKPPAGVVELPVINWRI